MQGSTGEIVQMFEWVGLYTNLGKNMAMKYTPGFIWEQMGKDAYNWQETGKGATFWEKKRKRVSCDK